MLEVISHGKEDATFRTTAENNNEHKSLGFGVSNWEIQRQEVQFGTDNIPMMIEPESLSSFYKIAQ